MHYVIQPLSEQLFFIKWQRRPGPATRPEGDYVRDLSARMEASPAPLYFLSDLRHGQIVNLSTLNQLGQITAHRHYGGGVAFSPSPLAGVFVETFTRFATPEKGEDVMFSTLEAALARLESMQPGITAGVDWEAILNPPASAP